MPAYSFLQTIKFVEAHCASRVNNDDKNGDRMLFQEKHEKGILLGLTKWKSLKNLTMPF